MKKFGLIALLSLLTLGVAACGGNDDSSKAPSTPSTPAASTPAPSTPAPSTPAPSTPSASTPTVDKVDLPAAWGENPGYTPAECSVTLIPGTPEGTENSRSVKEFLNVEGIRFIDLRDASEGYGKGHIQGFESISYFNTIVSKSADVKTLYTSTEDGFVANYDESESVMNTMFPKDAVLFVMCQGGVRVTPFLQLLDQLGYDMSKIYNVGGWGNVAKAENYAGYEVSLGIGASSITYDFSHLTPVDGGEAEAKAVRRAADLPAAWGENPGYTPAESTITLIPGTPEGTENSKAVKDYFTTENIRFIDLRDASEGYGKGHIQKFESISYFNTIVSKSADVKTLYTSTEDGFVANYDESESVMNTMFPKDAVLFVMCQGGVRVTPFLQLLDQLGYDMSKIYNVGGWGNVAKAENYAGYEVSLGIGASSITYDFSLLTPVAA